MTPRITKIIKDMVYREFPDAQVQEINVEDATDSDGDPILRVTIVFKTSRDIDTRKTSGLVRHLWPQLQAAEESRFPLFRLMTSADAKRLGTATA